MATGLSTESFDPRTLHEYIESHIQTFLRCRPPGQFECAVVHPYVGVTALSSVVPPVLYETRVDEVRGDVFLQDARQSACCFKYR